MIKFLHPPYPAFYTVHSSQELLPENLHQTDLKWHPDMQTSMLTLETVRVFGQICIE